MMTHMNPRPRQKNAVMMAALCGALMLIGWQPPGFCTQVKAKPELKVSTDLMVDVGLGSYAASPPPGARTPPTNIFRTKNCVGPVPTNDWWSSLAWEPLSSPLFCHPMSVQATETGLQVNYPGANMVANQAAIMGGGGSDLVIGHSQVKKFSAALVDEFSDWFVTARFDHEAGDENLSLHTTFGHGSPFVFIRVGGGEPTLSFTELPRVWAGDRNSAVLGITIANRHYGVFAPSGSTFSDLSKPQWQASTDGQGYLAIALLPEPDPATLADFQKYAYFPVTGSTVRWEFDPTSAQVISTFTCETRFFDPEQTVESPGTIFALYPHQWLHCESPFYSLSYRSVRGEMKIVTGDQFQTKMRYPGVLPSMPVLDRPETQQTLKGLLIDLIQQEETLAADTYWLGKQLGSWATTIPLAQQVGPVMPPGQADVAEQLLGKITGSLENFFTATRADGSIKSVENQHFAYDANWGTIIGYPASYGSDNDLNDHHFHYGYFIRAAAAVARNDPAWAKPERWGGMVQLLIDDIACSERNDSRFPFLRNFDPYAGHSWASGHGKFGDGNNNESSSEAVNAWYGLILWGEVTNNTKVRDLGVYLLTTEIQAIQCYWFDVNDTFHHPDYSPSVVTMVWGGKGANATWFSANPELVHGINWLPFTGASLYLGQYPDYCEKNYQALVQENIADDQKKNGGTSLENLQNRWDAWEDLVWMYRALSDPDDAVKQFRERSPNVSASAGNTFANTWVWVSTLQAYGHVDPTVWADTTFYAVFSKDQQRTYVVWNTDKVSRTVQFSDGTRIECAAQQVTVSQLGF